MFLQPLGGRLVYLSDLQPAEYRFTPFLTVSWPYRTDRNVTGGILRWGGRLASKGLGVHTAARLAYALDRPYKRFQVESGIDDSTTGRGSVEFRIFVDGKEEYVGDPVRGGSPPVPINVDGRRQAAGTRSGVRRARRRARSRGLAQRPAREVR